MLLCCQRMLLMWHSTALQGKREVPVLKFCNQSITARQQSATHHRKLMYPLGPWGFAQVLNQTLSNTMWMWNKAILIMSWLLGTKKGPITKYLPCRSLWSLYLKFLQFSVTFWIWLFFPAVILTLHIGQGRQLTSCYKSQSQPFPQFSQAQNI